DAPRPEVAELGKVFAACGERVEVADLISRMHVPVLRTKRQSQRVMVGGGRAAVASDEAHRRSAFALPGEEEEVADDHAEVVEVPVQCLAVPGGLQPHVTEPLDLGGFAGRT